MNAPVYNFAYLDEQTKRMIRRAILKAIAIPGYQVPFASREMPMPYGWGTGGVQVTAAVLGPDDVLKVIDQGSTTLPTPCRSASSSPRPPESAPPPARWRQRSYRRATGSPRPRSGAAGPGLSGSHSRPLRFLEPRETETRRMHALADYGVMRQAL
jgi:alpha-D-ribose 1-methylphosphonate 5-phosphate C-P lyase